MEQSALHKANWVYYIAKYMYILSLVSLFKMKLTSVILLCSPKCRFEYKRSDTPSRYYCYCGKVEDPPLDPWLVPHSCGQVCEREFKPPCGHKCLLLCHPGTLYITFIIVWGWLFICTLRQKKKLWKLN